MELKDLLQEEKEDLFILRDPGLRLFFILLTEI
jgi:hypothetical protein